MTATPLVETLCEERFRQAHRVVSPVIPADAGVLG